MHISFWENSAKLGCQKAKSTDTYRELTFISLKSEPFYIYPSLYHQSKYPWKYFSQVFNANTLHTIGQNIFWNRIEIFMHPTYFLILGERTLCCKCLGSFAFLWCKIPMFRRVGMRAGGRISSLASKCQDFKVEMLFFQQLYVMKLKTSKFKVLAFCCQWRYHYQIQITRCFYHKNQILKC